MYKTDGAAEGKVLTIRMARGEQGVPMRLEWTVRFSFFDFLSLLTWIVAVVHPSPQCVLLV